jgi:hypothetical protein
LDIKDGQDKVRNAITSYIRATTQLTAVIGVQLLSIQRDSDILGLFKVEDYEERHRMVKKDRVLRSEQWFLKSTEYTDWVGNESSALICPGIGIYHALILKVS